jgi:hypothetical protein
MPSSPLASTEEIPGFESPLLLNRYREEPVMGDIGKPLKHIELEPVEAPVTAPVEAPVEEPVPA